MQQARIHVYFFEKQDRFLVRDAIRDRFAPRGSTINIELYLLDPCSQTMPEQRAWVFWLSLGSQKDSHGIVGDYQMDRGKVVRGLRTIYRKMGGTIVSNIYYRDEQGSFEIPQGRIDSQEVQGDVELSRYPRERDYIHYT